MHKNGRKKRKQNLGKIIEVQSERRRVYLELLTALVDPSKTEAKTCR